MFCIGGIPSIAAAVVYRLLFGSATKQVAVGAAQAIEKIQRCHSVRDSSERTPLLVDLINLTHFRTPVFLAVPAIPFSGAQEGRRTCRQIRADRQCAPCVS